MKFHVLFIFSLMILHGKELPCPCFTFSFHFSPKLPKRDRTKRNIKVPKIRKNLDKRGQKGDKKYSNPPIYRAFPLDNTYLSRIKYIPVGMLDTMFLLLINPTQKFVIFSYIKRVIQLKNNVIQRKKRVEIWPIHENI